MAHESTDTDIVATHAEAERLELAPLIVLEELEPFLPGDGSIEVRRLGTGHSNETYLVSRDDHEWVLRRPPRPPYAPTAHDVVREYRILMALAGLDVRAPRPYAVCDDPGAIGAPFYLMEFVEGDVVRDRFPPALDVPAGRRRCLEQFVDCLLYTSPSPRDRQKSRMPSSA